MRTAGNSDCPVSAASNHVSVLSIVIDDFDSAKATSDTSKENPTSMPEVSLYQPPRPYTRQSSDASIKKILEEAEHRKHEFWKLIDEHDAVIENLKKIEQLETNGNFCKINQQATVST